MMYNSTRNSQVEVPSAQAIAQGISSEGGLFVPRELPSLSQSDLAGLVKKPYVERAAFVLSKFLTDFTKEELEECCTAAYTGGKFRSPAVAPLHKLEDEIGRAHV